MLPWVRLLVCCLATAALTAAGVQAQAPAGKPVPPGKQVKGGKLSPAEAKQKEAEEKKKKEENKRLAPYLTPDGKLRSAIEVRDEETGFRGGTFAGLIYRVETNGNWSVTQIFRRQPSLIGQGTLNAKQLRQLALALADNDVLSLPSAGPPIINPHVITISYGSNQAVLTFGVDQRLPAPNAPAPEVLSRFSGIATAVGGAIRGAGTP